MVGITNERAMPARTSSFYDSNVIPSFLIVLDRIIPCKLLKARSALYNIPPFPLKSRHTFNLSSHGNPLTSFSPAFPYNGFRHPRVRIRTTKSNQWLKYQTYLDAPTMPLGLAPYGKTIRSK